MNSGRELLDFVSFIEVLEDATFKPSVIVDDLHWYAKLTDDVFLIT